jgi:ribonuclease R
MARGGPASEVVVEIVGAGRGAVAQPAFEPGPDIRMASATLGDARVGDLARILVRGRSARVLHVYGRSRAPGAVMAGFLAAHGRGFGTPRAVARELDEISEGDPLADPGRRNLVDQDVVTIDPEGAKDHDDAIAAVMEGENVRLWVHIADVSHYVVPGSDLDRDAARRGCSLYLPGTVDPMLPSRLSSDLCSLRPGVPRRVLSVEMRVTPSGEVRDTRFFPAVICSERRLTYPEVDAHLAGAPLGAPRLEATIAAAHVAAQRLRARRMARGALEIGSSEPVYTLEPDRVTGVHMESQTPSHSLVEDCMIAANEAVAAYLIARKAPTVFRYHADPDQVQVERLYAQLAALEVATPALPERDLGPAERRDAVRAACEAVGRHLAARSALGDTDGRALWVLVLRALKQAFYSPDSVTHSGLASPAYLHFTSPIRRYPDLLVHRALVGALGIGAPGPGHTDLEVAARESSDAERAAVDLERRADRICAALLLERQLRDGDWTEVFAGEVTGLISQGVFVRFASAFEGFLPARALSGGELVLDEFETGLIDGNGRHLLRLGTRCDVRVAEIEPLRGRVRLERAETQVPAGAARQRAQRRMARGPR